MTEKWILNEKPCGECRHFHPWWNHEIMGGCKKKLFGVFSTQPVLAPENEPCFEEQEASDAAEI